ncbi:MAG: transcriptional regulator, LuxR family [Caulobacter sp.]|nr:transcriptional regulator, LuxR family [Caulobacter sp.]
MHDLTRLSPSQQRVLLLLAEGHTAKSIATELRMTEGAVNERLREARRKTGVGSSRELARRLRGANAAPLEIRPKEIGVAAPAALTDTRGHRWGRRWGWPVVLGAFAMITFASAIGALAALAVAHGPPAPGNTPPRVVSTYPAANARVPAGKLALSVTFDRPMRNASYSFVRRDSNSFPICGTKPAQSADRRTFTLACVVEAGRGYEVGFNSDRNRNFVGQDGVPATPAVLRFSAR